jgi:hypothetical protein
LKPCDCLRESTDLNKNKTKLKTPTKSGGRGSESCDPKGSMVILRGCVGGGKIKGSTVILQITFQCPPLMGVKKNLRDPSTILRL